MKRIASAIMALACVASPCLAQQVMDGSDKDLDPALVKKVISAVEAQLKDPYSAQFDHLRPWDLEAGSICGRVNAKNELGGYVGFQNFRYIIDQDNAYIHDNTGCK